MYVQIWSSKYISEYNKMSDALDSDRVIQVALVDYIAQIYLIIFATIHITAHYILIFWDGFLCSFNLIFWGNWFLVY
jgi:hypothetical protein